MTFLISSLFSLSIASTVVKQPFLTSLHSLPRLLSPTIINRNTSPFENIMPPKIQLTNLSTGRPTSILFVLHSLRSDMISPYSWKDPWMNTILPCVMRNALSVKMMDNAELHRDSSPRSSLSSAITNCHRILSRP